MVQEQQQQQQRRQQQRSSDDDDGDPFAEAHGLEQRHLADGTADGRRRGAVIGVAEGRELGLQKGYEIGLEAGGYAGSVRAWRALQARSPAAVPPRVDRLLASMERQLAQLPLYEPRDEALTDVLEELRGKHRTAAALMMGGGSGGGGRNTNGEGGLPPAQVSLTF